MLAMTSPARVACVIVAAGSGSRLGAGVPKAFVELAGEPLVLHAVNRVIASEAVGHVVVVAPAQWLGQAQQLVGDGSRTRPTSDLPVVTMTVVAGGTERQDSVAAGVAALPDEVDVVLVHDAARCLAPPSLVSRVAEAVLAGHKAVVPGLPVADTIKEVRLSRPDQVERVTGTVDRRALRIAQTPQGFDRATLKAAHAAAAEVAAQVLAPVVEQPGGAAAVEALAPLYTDDAEMAERVTDVVVVAGDPLAFKITGPHDLSYADWFLTRSQGTPQ
jgi:2-C-methyl-D-erythritol 4-phosphate cytidylyltransferase